MTPKHLLQKYSTNKVLFELVWMHSNIVLDIAKHIDKKKKLNINWNFWKPGFLLHDIGTFVTSEAFFSPNPSIPYIQHGIIGADIVELENLPTEYRNLCERHTGSGLTKEEVREQKLPLPLKNYIPKTTEEKLLCYADKFHSKTPEWNDIDEFIKEYGRKFGKIPLQRMKVLREEFGDIDTSHIQKKYKQWHENFRKEYGEFE